MTLNHTKQISDGFTELTDPLRKVEPDEGDFAPLLGSRMAH